MAARTPIETEDPALSLTMAVIESSPTPLLLLGGDLRVVGASVSFCDAFGIDPATAVGGTLFELGSGEWDVPQLRALLGAIATGTPQVAAFEMELGRPGFEPRCLIINARRLTYRDIGQPRLLVAVADVTDARANEHAKDEAIDRLGVLLSEVRHRVANSLQIVSSLLLQTARRSGSPAIRDSLTVAHNRVMSVSALERQLSASPDGDQNVELATYFTSLCDNITASMIDDRKSVVLAVTGGGLVSSRASISLGLIVTELVINALKHAFPAGRTGRIEISYQAHGPNWTLSVRDDGVGIPADRPAIRAGLGTGIVEALARQLQATVEVVSAVPGTIVCIEHIHVALVGDGSAQSTKGLPGKIGPSHERTLSERSHANGRSTHR